MTKKNRSEIISFADSVRSGRESRGLSVRELADMVGVSMMTLYRWQEGRTTPHPYLKKRVLEVLGKPITRRGNT